MSNQATLTIGEKDFPLNVLVGTENEHALDISTLRKDSKCITFDDGYGNTGSCESEITFIDGDYHANTAVKCRQHLHLRLT